MTEKNRIPSKMNLLLSFIAISIISFLVISTIHFQSVSAQVSVQQAIDYWEQCKAIFGHDICKGMVGLGEQVHLLPARSTEGIDYWEQCKNSFGIDTCKGFAAIGEWLGLIRAY